MTEEKENWNNDIQDLFEIIDLGLRKMLRKKKISQETYDKWLKDIELSSIGKPFIK